LAIAGMAPPRERTNQTNWGNNGGHAGIVRLGSDDFSNAAAPENAVTGRAGLHLVLQRQHLIIPSSGIGGSALFPDWERQKKKRTERPVKGTPAGYNGSSHPPRSEKIFRCLNECDQSDVYLAHKGIGLLNSVSRRNDSRGPVQCGSLWARATADKVSVIQDLAMSATEAKRVPAPNGASFTETEKDHWLPKAGFFCLSKTGDSG